MRKHEGFTLLELMITIGIVAIVIGFMSPDFASWNTKQAFENSFNELRRDLSNTRYESLSQGNTTRLEVVLDGDDYTVNTYIAPVPVSSCDPAGSWISMSSKVLDVSSAFSMTGSGVGDLCFYRDGSTSGAQYNLDGGTAAGTATIIVTIATGYIDATLN